MQVDVEWWGRQEAWELDDAASIISGGNPRSEEGMTKEAHSAREAISIAISIGRLFPISGNEGRIYFLAAELLHWASEKNFVLPSGLHDIVLSTAANYVTHREAAATTPTVRDPKAAYAGVAADPDTCGLVEEVMNGGPLDWAMWALRTKITPADAAKLIFCIDPLRWPGMSCAQGAIDSDLQYEIAMRTAVLEDMRLDWSLTLLVDLLGCNGAPAGMQQAARSVRADEAARLAEAVKAAIRRPPPPPPTYLDVSRPYDFSRVPDPSTTMSGAPQSPCLPSTPQAGGEGGQDVRNNGSRREKQIAAIVEAVALSNFPAMSIPTGGKKVVLALCMAKFPALFGAGEDPFLDAWKKALKAGKVRMADHARFSGRG